MQELVKIRKYIHRNPEVSNNEIETSKYISNLIKELNPDKEITISNTGKAFVFDSGKGGKTTVFRAELDALPINEKNSINNVSQNKGVAHSCGHDGHMTILYGLAQKISQYRPKSGKLVLLFQHAEEVEQGAKEVVENEEIVKLDPDYFFGLHNIPGEEINRILFRNGSISAASKGLTIKLIGKTSHAAEPENGISPADAISEIIKKLHELRDNKSLFNDLVLLTIINIQLGEIAFGTSPGYAEIRVTLRSFENEDMEKLTSLTETLVKEIAEKEKLKFEFEYSEVFPASVNSEECTQMIENGAKENGLEISILDNPYKWSEDFGYYTEKYKGGFFGIGAGVDHPQLHNPEYDFPDELLETGVNMFFSIYKKVHL